MMQNFPEIFCLLLPLFCTSKLSAKIFNGINQNDNEDET